RGWVFHIVCPVASGKWSSADTRTCSARRPRGQLEHGRRGATCPVRCWLPDSQSVPTPEPGPGGEPAGAIPLGCLRGGSVAPSLVPEERVLSSSGVVGAARLAHRPRRPCCAAGTLFIPGPCGGGS